MRVGLNQQIISPWLAGGCGRIRPAKLARPRSASRYSHAPIANVGCVEQALPLVTRQIVRHGGESLRAAQIMYPK
jgi:hypothetical protein